MIYRRIMFFFNDTATTEIYTLSLHDALPIYKRNERGFIQRADALGLRYTPAQTIDGFNISIDRKSTRLNSSHPSISYAVFCLKKKKNITTQAPKTYTCYIPIS